MKNRILQLYTISFFIVILSMTNSGCKEKNKDCHTNGTCPPDYRWMPLGEAKNYLYALPGSYWIYKNTVTGDLDTQTCFSFSLDTIIVKGIYNDTKQTTIEYEKIKRIIKCSFEKRYFYDETAGYNPNMPRELKAIMERDADGAGIKAFFYPFVLNEQIGTGSSVTTYKGIDSTFDIQGKTYQNVARFEVDLDDIWYNNIKYPNTIYFWAKDVGLIKRENKTENFSWELIEYNIIK